RAARGLALRAGDPRGRGRRHRGGLGHPAEAHRDPRGPAESMTLAVLYDMHGNLGALEAVLRDAEANGCDSFLLGGDYALFGPQPRETVERLDSLGAEWIRGNGERWTAAPDDAPDDEVVQGALAASREELGEDLVARLA